MLKHGSKTFKSIKKRNKRLIGVFLFVLGLLIFFFPSIYKQYIGFKSKEIQENIAELKLTAPESTSSGAIVDKGPIRPDKSLLEQKYLESELPKRIIIPSRSIDLPVKPAKIVGETWELSDETASFGLGSALPGKAGNAVIFAHAKWKLFGPLRNIKKGEKIYVLTGADWYLYEVKEIKTVLPNRVEVIKPTEDETLTLYTCSGFADTKRLIVVAKRSPD